MSDLLTAAQAANKEIDENQNSNRNQNPGTDNSPSSSQQAANVFSQNAMTDDYETLVDLVFVIDITGSMGPFIENVRKMVTTLGPDIIEALRQKNRVVKSIRAQAICYRDYYYDGERYCIERTDRFFELIEERDTLEFGEFIQTISPAGGEDIPECGLEALAMAMKLLHDEGRTPETSKQKTRHIIVLCTDAPAHEIGEDRPQELINNEPVFYPSGMPKSLSALKEAWEGKATGAASQYNMDQNAKRLCMFSDKSYPWIEISENSPWTQVNFSFIVSNEGGKELDTGDILALIKNSV